MRLALLAARLPPAHDGVGDHAHRLAGALQSDGHDVMVLTAGEATTWDGVRLEITGERWGPLATARAVAALRAYRAEALVVEYTPFLYGARSQTPLTLLLAARASGIRSAVLVHEAFHAHGSAAVRSTWKARAFALRDRLTLASADVICVPSVGRAASVALHLPDARDRIAFVPIGANVEPPARYRRRPQTPVTIVAFGVVMPRRRLERSIAAVAQLIAGGTDVRFDIIGRTFDAGYAAELAERAGAAGIARYVRFRGELSPAELSRELATATVAIHTAEEGSVASSGSLLALLAHGVPTVALRTRFDDPVFDGVLHYAGDDAGLASSLLALATEPQCADGMSPAAATAYRLNFGWPTVARRLGEALRMEAADARLVAA